MYTANEIKLMAKNCNSASEVYKVGRCLQYLILRKQQRLYHEVNTALHSRLKELYRAS